MNNINFSQRLYELRKDKELTQKQLSNDLGIIYQNIGNWETGLSSPNLNTFKKLCIYFDVSADYLLGLSDIKEKR